MDVGRGSGQVLDGESLRWGGERGEVVDKGGWKRRWSGGLAAVGSRWRCWRVVTVAADAGKGEGSSSRE